jgi:hypothetical protein
VIRLLFGAITDIDILNKHKLDEFSNFSTDIYLKNVNYFFSIKVIRTDDGIRFVLKSVF